MKIIQTKWCLIPALFLGSFSAYAWPFKSCDERWKEAWTENGYPSVLPEDKRPDCEPTDPYLTKDIGGKDGYELRQRLIKNLKQLNEAQKHIVISGYSYTAQLGSVYVFADVYNGSSQTMKHITMTCRVIANNAIELFSGAAYLDISLISGGRANVPVIFKHDVTTTADWIISKTNKYEESAALDVKGYDINQLQVECEKESVL